MAKYILDTNVLLHIVRNSKVAKHVISSLDLWSPEHFILISVVTMAEIRTLAYTNNWGKEKAELLVEILSKIATYDISKYDSDLIDAYIKVDNYSLYPNKFPDLEPDHSSSVKMGKNDLWIAATAIVTNCHILTTDNNFTHLDKKLLMVRSF